MVQIGGIHFFTRAWLISCLLTSRLIGRTALGSFELVVDLNKLKDLQRVRHIVFHRQNEIEEASGVHLVPRNDFKVSNLNRN